MAALRPWARAARPAAAWTCVPRMLGGVCGAGVVPANPLRQAAAARVAQPARGLRTWIRRRAAQMAVEEADGRPDDARAQAAALEALVAAQDHDAAIARFEDERLARNEACAAAYLTALYHAGELGRAVRRFLPADAAAARGAEPLSLLNFGTKERPLHVRGIGDGRSAGRSPVVVVLNALIVTSLLYGAWSMYRMASAGVGGAQGAAGSGPLGAITARAHRVAEGGDAVTFADVQGCDEAKAELVEVVDFLRSPAKYTRLGARMPRGVLLVGPPGAGKTLLARAVAGEAGVPFIYAAGSQFDEVFVGVGSMRVRQMFEHAKAVAPAIIFIDEIDAIGSRRNARDPQHARMSLNQLLTELDGFAPNTSVVVIAATNLPESLDRALLRPGRFDRHVTVPLPDVRGRRQILELYVRGRGGADGTAPDVDTAALARATPGFSGAELFKLVNTARIRASLEGAPRLEARHLEAARDDMIMGGERRSALVPEADRVLTAYHEGGHALVALCTPDAVPVHKATIVPRGRALGLVAQLPERDELSVTRAQLLARLDVAMAGRAAEALVFGPARVTTGASSDFETATAIARAMVAHYGMSDAVGAVAVRDSDDYGALSGATRALIDAEVRRLLDESAARVRRVLEARRPALDRIARALLDYETLTRVELEAVYAGEALPEALARPPRAASAAPPVVIPTALPESI